MTSGPAGPADWDARYAAGAPWGSEPNVWVRAHTEDLRPGRALDVASGDGRHALWLAAQGWDVDAVDFSAVAVERGSARAERLAATGLLPGTVRWHVADVTTHLPPAARSDLVLLAYLHLPAPALATTLGHATRALAPGGLLVLVGHDRSNLTHGVGGPQDPAILTDAATVAEVLAAAGLRVRLATVEERPVPDADRPARDTVVVAERQDGHPDPVARTRSAPRPAAQITPTRHAG